MARFKKLEIKNELLHVARYALFPDQEVRIYRLILRLALAETFLTSDTLAEDMSVSRNTILSDLEKMEILLYEYDVTLQRRNHYGLFSRRRKSDSIVDGNCYPKRYD